MKLMNGGSTADLFDSVPTRTLSMPSGREARERKMNGQFRAASKGGSMWVELILAKLKGFLNQRKAEQSSEFTFEEFRVLAEEQSWPLPASHNAWGALPRIARSAGLCEFTGRAEEAKRPASHARLIKVWRAL